ncbi:MAG: helix-turn-helix domain-containing protein [Caulobacter sp.]
MTDLAHAPTSARDAKKDEVRGRITEALISLLSEGAADLSHDAVAQRAGVGRRTVYRYFPDRESLMQSAWDQVTGLAGPDVTFPATEAEMLGSLEAIYAGFDRIAPLVTLLRSTPQGRAVRRSQNARRTAGYTAAAADAVKDLPPEDQKLATAVLQVLHTTPWLEMRDHWGLEAPQMARAMRWAMSTLLRDLKTRGGRPLGEEPA